MAQQQNLKVFISYARSDSELALKIYKRIKNLGHDAWIDQNDINAGEPWEVSLRNAIKQSDIFLSLLSKNSFYRRGVLKKEQKIAIGIMDGLINTDIFIVPMRLDDCEIPDELAQLQYVDYFDKNGWAKLKRTFSKVLSEKLVKKAPSPKIDVKVSDGQKSKIEVDRFSTDDEHFANNSKYFIGREDALEEYYRLFSYRRQKNTLYVRAQGGHGKSWLLDQIHEENERFQINRKVFDIIDFYEVNNRSVKGVRDQIIELLGKKQFETFLDAEKEQLRVEQELESPTILAAKRERADFEFFENLNRATSGQEVVFLFDTFEVVQNTDVGRWFIEEFIEDAENIIVVFAGRPTSIPFEIPFRTILIELKPFNQSEAEEFYRAKVQSPHSDPDVLSSAEIERLRLQPGIDSLPLRLELALKYLSSSKDGKSGLNLILGGGLTTYEVEELLIDFIGSTRDPLNRILKDMAVLKRRFNREIIEYLLYDGNNYGLFSSYEKISKELKAHNIVKRRRDGSFALHDRVQDLVEEYIFRKPRFGITDEASLDLFGKIVDGWYIQKINNPDTEEKLRILLKAEHLGYILDRLPDRSGLDLYQACFEEVKKGNLFLYNELILNEIYEHRVQLGPKSYDYFKEQGEWLYRQNRFRQASSIFQMMAYEYKDDNNSLWTSLSYWGACLLVLGKFEKAKKDALLVGYELARKENNDYWLSVFENSLAYIEEVFLGNWDKARELYEYSLFHAENSGNKSLQMKMRIKLGEFSALIGDYDEARSYCEPVVKKGFSSPNQMMGEAYLVLGKINRYQERQIDGENDYQEALKIFRAGDGGNEWVCITLQNLGASYYLNGYEKRIKYKDLGGALQRQKDAFSALLESLGIVRQFSLFIYLPESLYRLGRVLSELQEILAYIGNYAESTSVNKQHSKDLNDLIENVFESLELPEEDHWRNLKSLLPGVSFNRLIKNKDILGIAQRLCEVGYLEADSRERVHASLESLIEAARIALKRGRFTEVLGYTEKMQFLRGMDLQENLFIAVADIILGDLYFERGNYEMAFQKYKDSFITLIKEKGYGRHRFNRHYKELEERIMALPAKQANEWIMRLLAYWTPEFEKEHRSIIIGLKGLADLVEG